MTAATQAPVQPSAFDCVIFDCDGVLVDSEPIVHRVLNEMLNELGIAISLEESKRWFLGRAVRDELGNIERRLGKPLPENWLSTWLARRNQVRGGRGGGRAARARRPSRPSTARGLPVCVASGADRIKVKLQLTRTGLVELFQQDTREHIFSSTEVERSKPAPDVYLLAARTMSVDPSRCVVVEDSPAGVTAGVAAGMTVLGYAALNDARELRGAGARATFTDMRQLPELIG